MKVLFACPFVPWPLVNGGKTRTYKLLEAVKERAEVHLRVIEEPETDPEAEERLAEACASVEILPRAGYGLGARLTQPKIERWFHSPRLAERLRDDLADGGFDLLHLDELLLARVPPAASRVPVVQHHHKLDTVFQATLGAGGALERAFDLFKLRRLERESTRRTRHHVLCSRDDANVLEARYGALDFGIVANGFDPAVFSPDPTIERERDRILYLGSMDYGPNVDGVRWFCAEILPRIREHRPNVVLDVVGPDPAPEVRALDSAKVNVHGRADEVPPWLRRTAALVVPLRVGGGTRLKIAEALGVGTPVVSTRIGAEGLALADGEHAALADGAKEFAERTLALLEDPLAAAELGRRGRELALGCLTWEALGGELVECWRRAASG